MCLVESQELTRFLDGSIQALLATISTSSIVAVVAVDIAANVEILKLIIPEHIYWKRFDHL